MSTTYQSPSYGGAGTAGPMDFGPWSCHGHGPPFPVKAAIVIGGFLVFPPLGLAALAYFALRHKFGPGGPRSWGGPHGAGWGRGGRCGGGRGHWRGPDDDDERRKRPEAAEAPETGNSAFEARRREVLDKIEAERARLAEEAKAFREFSEREKRARDQAEFDRFMAEKNTPADNGKTE